MAVANVVAKFEADISDVQAKMAALKKSFSEAGDSSRDLSERFKTVGAEMSRVGRGMTVGLTLPLAAIGAAAVKASVDFESSMSKIVGLVGIASDEVKQMQEEVLLLAGETAKAPVELANGLFVVTSAGLRGETAMQALEMSARAGAAGLGETNDIARALAGALSAYGSDVLSAADATDAIVATARAGNFETSQFAAAIGRVLPFAKQAGASFQDMGGAVALLTRVNGDAAQSVTQMAALFRAFVVPSEEAKKSLDAVGLSAGDLRDSIAKQGLPATLQMLDKALGGNREQLGRILGSSEAASAAFQILDANANTIAETFGVVADSAGMTDEAFAAAADTAGFKMQQAMVSLQATLIQIGDIIVPLVTEVAKFAKTMLDGFQSLPGPVKTVITAFAGIVAALGPILWIGGKIVAMLGILGGAFVAAKAKAILAMKGMALSVRGATDTIRLSFWEARASMGMFGATAKTTAITVRMALVGMATAAKSLMASIGPLGWAMIAAGAAFEIISGHAAGTQNAIANLRDEINTTTGALSAAGRQWIASELRTNISQEDLAMMESYGISISGFIAALEAGGPTLDAYREKIRLMQEQQSQTGGLFDTGVLNVGTVNSVNTIVSTLDGMIGQYEAAGLAAQDAANAQVDAAMVAGNGVRAMAGTYRAAAAEQRALANGTASDGTLMQNVVDKTAEAVRGLRDAFSELNAVTSDIRTADAAKDAWERLTAGIEANGDGFGRATEQQRENRNNLLDYIDAQVAFAESLKDPQEQLAALQEVEANVKTALKAGGVKPSDSAIYKSVRDAVDEAEKKVGEMETAVEDAESKGLDVATAIATGIEQGMSQSEAGINAAGAVGGDALATGMNNSLGISSPSRVAMTAGRMTGLGLIQGLNQMRSAASGAGMNIAANIVRGMITSLNNGQGPVAAAARAIVAAAIAAARAESQEGSPSRVFMGIGNNMILGLEFGVRSGVRRGENTMSAAARAFTRAFMREFFPKDMGAAESAIANAIANAEQSLADARDALKDANKGVADAEKELNQIRRDNAKAVEELERAERKAAQARAKVDALIAKGASADKIKEAKREAKNAEDELKDARQEHRKVARDLEAAENALARARKKASEAADATKLAEWVKENGAALEALQKIGAQYDYIVAKMEQVQDAASTITDLLARPLGTASELSRMFEFGTDPRTLARNYTQLADTIRQAFSVLTDPQIVGRGAARANRRLMNQTIRQLEQYVTRIIALQEEYAANAEQMARNEEQWRIDEAALTESLRNATTAYDTANKELERIVGERDGLIKKITDGFRSFINDLSGITDGVAAAVKKQTTELANGVRLIVESADTTSAAGVIAENMRKRLEEVRNFSKNVKTLMERGLDPALVRDFIESGVSGSGNVVAQLASATDEELQAINETQQELLRHAGEFATGVGDAYYGAAISAQQAVVRDAKAAVDAAQKALDDARAAYEAERARLEAEQDRIETEIASLTAQIEALITNMMSTLIPATEAAAQSSIDAMIAQFKRDFPRLKRELGLLMDALAASMQRTVKINVEADTSGAGGPGRSTRSAFAPSNVVVQTPATGRSVTVAPNAVSVNITAAAGVDGAALTAQVKTVVDESLQELAREIVSA